MLETQITQVASSFSRAPSRVSSQHETNLIEHCDAITLGSGKVLEELKVSDKDVIRNEEIGNFIIPIDFYI